MRIKDQKIQKTISKFSYFRRKYILFGIIFLLINIFSRTGFMKWDQSHTGRPTLDVRCSVAASLKFLIISFFTLSEVQWTINSWLSVSWLYPASTVTCATRGLGFSAGTLRWRLWASTYLQSGTQDAYEDLQLPMIILMAREVQDWIANTKTSGELKKEKNFCFHLKSPFL